MKKVVFTPIKGSLRKLIFGKFLIVKVSLFLILSTTSILDAFAQNCSSCTVTINNNGNSAQSDTPSNLADGSVICITANNRTRDIDLRNRNNLTICIEEGAEFTGSFTNYQPSSTITVNVHGNYGGSLSLNNSNSSFNIFSSGIYTQSGSLTVNNGSVTNQGTFSRPLTLESSALFANSGTFNNSLTIRNPNGVVINNTGSISPTSFTDGGGSNYTVNIEPNSTLLSNVAITTNGTWNVGGTVTINSSLTLGNNGNSGPRFNLFGSSQLIVRDDLITNRGIIASQNSKIDVGRDFQSNNNGDVSNGITINDNVQFKVGRNVTANRPITANNNSSIQINGNLDLPNVGSAGININNNSSILVSGITNVRAPIRMRDNAVGTFGDNVNLFNVGNSILDLQNNSDILIQGNLTAQQNGSTVIVRNTSQLVICNDRPPKGSTEGTFPPATRWGNTIESTGFYGGCRILPVELQSFDASFDSQNRTTILNWATAKEWENSHFEIERAIDQIAKFETIGNEEGVGFSDSTVNYNFEDSKLPLTGGIAYYRLKQVDFDGSYSYSEVVSIRIPAKTNVSGVWKAFPNPNKGGERFNLELVNRAAYDNEEVIVKLVSPVGKQQIFTGKDLRVISDNITQSFQKSTNGLYIVEVAWGKQKEQIKVMKQ